MRALLGELRRAIPMPFRRATSKLRADPSFLIIGAQKAGTTSLYSYLIQHPQVRSALRKEVHFFDHNYERGMGWYRSFFPLTGDDRSWITGEASPYYLFHPHVPERVHQCLPDTKILAVLRDPVERAYSHFQHSRSMGLESLDSFEEAVALESRRISAGVAALDAGARRAPEVEAFSYLRRGFYAPQIARWIGRFGSDAVKVVWSDDLFTRPSEVVIESLEFLGLEPNVHGIDLRPRNARRYEAIAPELRARLATVYEADAQELGSLVGARVPWV